MDAFTAIELRKCALGHAMSLTIGRPDLPEAQQVVKDAQAFLKFFSAPLIAEVLEPAKTALTASEIATGSSKEA